MSKYTWAITIKPAHVVTSIKHLLHLSHWLEEVKPVLRGHHWDREKVVY
jgi:hypothetical protein